jgi:hypothetical protein
MYKVVLFARPGQGNITTQSLAQPLNFSARYNYQKIKFDSTYDFSFPSGTSTATLNHGLGYIPKIRSYIDNFSSGSSPDSTALMDFGYFLSQFTAFQLYMDTNNIYYTVNNSGVSSLTGTLYTRVYYDS